MPLLVAFDCKCVHSCCYIEIIDIGHGWYRVECTACDPSEEYHVQIGNATGSTRNWSSEESRDQLPGSPHVGRFRWTLRSRAVVTHACCRPTNVNCHYGVRLVTCITGPSWPVRIMRGSKWSTSVINKDRFKYNITFKEWERERESYKSWVWIIRALFIPMWLLHERISLD